MYLYCPHVLCYFIDECDDYGYSLLKSHCRNGEHILKHSNRSLHKNPDVLIVNTLIGSSIYLVLQTVDVRKWYSKELTVKEAHSLAVGFRNLSFPKNVNVCSTRPNFNSSPVLLKRLKT